MEGFGGGGVSNAPAVASNPDLGENQIGAIEDNGASRPASDTKFFEDNTGANPQIVIARASNHDMLSHLFPSEQEELLRLDDRRRGRGARAGLRAESAAAEPSADYETLKTQARVEALTEVNQILVQALIGSRGGVVAAPPQAPGLGATGDVLGADDAPAGGFDGGEDPNIIELQ